MPRYLRDAITMTHATLWLVAAVGLLTAVVAFITGAGLLISGALLAIAVLLALGFHLSAQQIRRDRRRGLGTLVVCTVLLTVLTVRDWFMVVPLVAAWGAALTAWRGMRREQKHAAA